jgi:hypothetical protein
MCYQRYIRGRRQILVEKLRCPPAETMKMRRKRSCIAQAHTATAYGLWTTHSSLARRILPRESIGQGGIQLHAQPRYPAEALLKISRVGGRRLCHYHLIIACCGLPAGGPPGNQRQHQSKDGKGSFHQNVMVHPP